MNELTDKMITNELKDAAFMQNENTLIIVLMVGFLIVLGAIFIFSKNERQKFASLGILILFEILGFMVIGNNNFMKNAVNNGEWIVITDTVERVMESTDDDGDTSYFMVLEKTGRASLDSSYEASRYSTGDEVYVVVVMKNGEYKRTGVVYPSTYYYTGSH